MRTLKSVSVVIGCLLIFTVLFWYQPGDAKTVSISGEEVDKNVITVTGSADVMVVPDEAVITLGIDTRDKDIVKAKTENDKRVKDILGVTKKFNIDSKYVKIDYVDIRPGDITVRQAYDSYAKVDPQNYGYIVKKKMIVTLKNLAKFDDFLTDIVKNGAEYVQQVEFKTSELRTHKDQARELAVKAAREKADAMTAALGQKAGKAVSIKEEQEYYWSWYDSWYSGWYGNGSISTANSVQNIAPSGQQIGSDGAVPGQIKVRASVNIDFSLE